MPTGTNDVIAHHETTGIVESSQILLGAVTGSPSDITEHPERTDPA
ncbi:hypothetical protein AB0A74_00255 [Saccharothrix sp. NPDC042600]